MGKTIKNGDMKEKEQVGDLHSCNLVSGLVGEDRGGVGRLSNQLKLQELTDSNINIR